MEKNVYVPLLVALIALVIVVFLLIIKEKQKIATWFSRYEHHAVNVDAKLVREAVDTIISYRNDPHMALMRRHKETKVWQICLCRKKYLSDYNDDFYDLWYDVSAEQAEFIIENNERGKITPVLVADFGVLLAM